MANTIRIRDILELKSAMETGPMSFSLPRIFPCVRSSDAISLAGSVVLILPKYQDEIKLLVQVSW